MRGLFYNLGHMTGAAWRKGTWILQSVTGTEADSVAAEQGVGRDMAAVMSQQFENDTDPGSRRLVQTVGNRLAGRLVNPQRQFRFHVVRAPQANAFALPGGYIFVARALLDMCEWNADETAFVLGHEMGHVVKRHAIDRVINQTAINVASRASLASRGVGRHLLSLGSQFLQQAYSREQELEADNFGIRLMHSAGYELPAAVAMVEKLKAANGDDNDLPLGEYLSTHPPADDRIEHLRLYVRKHA